MSFLDLPAELRIQVYNELIYSSPLNEYLGAWSTSRQIKAELDEEWLRYQLDCIEKTMVEFRKYQSENPVVSTVSIIRPATAAEARGNITAIIFVTAANLDAPIAKEYDAMRLYLMIPLRLLQLQTRCVTIKLILPTPHVDAERIIEWVATDSSWTLDSKEKEDGATPFIWRLWPEFRCYGSNMLVDRVVMRVGSGMYEWTRRNEGVYVQDVEVAERTGMPFLCQLLSQEVLDGLQAGGSHPTQKENMTYLH